MHDIGELLRCFLGILLLNKDSLPVAFSPAHPEAALADLITHASSAAWGFFGQRAASE
jgi:hypothetical protein